MGKITWYPGHMAKAMAALQRVIKGVDLVLEVRDVRIPISSSNSKLSGVLKDKRHIVVLNKVDLVPRSSRLAALRCLEQQGLLALPASINSNSSIKQLLSTAVGWIERERSSSDLSVMMVVGLPNSGKSSLINALKMAARSSGVLDGHQAFNRRAAVGATPGLTRQVSGFQVSSSPLTYVLDTPGIMMPNIPDEQAGFRLALAGAIKDSVVGEEAIVKFYLSLLANEPRMIAALKTSTQKQHGHQKGRASSSSNGGAGSSDGKAKKQTRDIRAALIAAAEVDPQVALQVVVGDPSLAWHPGLDDIPAATAAAELDIRLDILHQHLGISGAIDPSQQLGYHIKILKAFRAGDLGKVMLDDVPSPS